MVKMQYLEIPASDSIYQFFLTTVVFFYFILGRKNSFRMIWDSYSVVSSDYNYGYKTTRLCWYVPHYMAIRPEGYKPISASLQK